MNKLGWALDFFGIVLNFLAGILLTPEAIGSERISRIEKSLRHSLVRTIMKLEISKLRLAKAEKDTKAINIKAFFLSLARKFGVPVPFD